MEGRLGRMRYSPGGMMKREGKRARVHSSALPRYSSGRVPLRPWLWYSLRMVQGTSGVCASPTYKGEAFYDVFSRDKLGWMVGDTKGKVYYTTDGGVTWAAEKISFTYALRGLDFPAPAVGVAVGEFGGILRSTVGKGRVWTKVTAPTTAHLWDVSFYNAKLGWAVGDKGTILHTKDGGAVWKLQPTGVTDRLESVCFTSATDGWAVGAGGVMLHTTTGGS